MSQTLTYVMGADRRVHVKDIQDFKIDFSDDNHNWVQARQFERGMRQVFVNIVNEDGTPFDLTGCNVWFEGLLPKTADGDFRVIDDDGYVPLDPSAGKFRFDMPGHAFTVAGSYRQAFFRILKNNNSVTTLEFDLDVLADKVIDGLVPKDWVGPFNKIADQMVDSLQKHTDDADNILADFRKKVGDLIAQLNQQGSTTTSMLTELQNRITELENKASQNNLFTQAEADAFKQGIQQELVRTSKHYQAVSDMVTDSSLGKGTYAGTAGYYEAGDGGAANYIITDSEPSTHYEKLNNGLYAKLIITDHVTPEQYGAKGDGVNDDTQAVQSALMSNNLVEFPVGKSYHTTSTITVTQVVNLNGNFSPIVYDGTDTAISFDAKLMREQHKRDFGIINDLKIKAPKADIALNWNGGIKTYVNNLKIYNFGHIAINIQYPGYETTFDHVWLIGKGGAETIGIAGNASDMNFGSLYGINVQTYMQMKGGAIHVEYLHPWCANVDTEDNPAIADDAYQAWFKKTCIIDYCNDAGAAHTRIEYIYADTYFNVVSWNTNNKYNSIGTVKTLGITSSFNRYDPDNEYNKYLYYLEIDRLDSGQPDLICKNLGFYPEIKGLNGQTTHKVIETSVNGTTVPIVEDRITQYSFTADGKTPEYTNIVNVEALPMACNNKDWGAVLAYRIGQKINNTVSYLTTGLPSETTTIFTFYLRPLPVRIGQQFKYMVDDITKQY